MSIFGAILAEISTKNASKTAKNTEGASENAFIVSSDLNFILDYRGLGWNLVKLSIFDEIFKNS